VTAVPLALALAPEVGTAEVISILGRYLAPAAIASLLAGGAEAATPSVKPVPRDLSNEVFAAFNMLQPLRPRDAAPTAPNLLAHDPAPRKFAWQSPDGAPGPNSPMEEVPGDGADAGFLAPALLSGVPFSLSPPVVLAPWSPFVGLPTPSPLDVPASFGSLAPSLPAARTWPFDPYALELGPSGGFGSLAPLQPPSSGSAAS
jgi:hypothetical protein